MKSNKIVISGIGCALADYLYNQVSFNDASFRKYLSKKTGDGGLSPGKLVFTEELEQFAGQSYPEILAEITCNRESNAMNIGGPSIVALIHAAQMLNRDNYEINFYGIAGNDATADAILRLFKKTPLNSSNYLKLGTRPTPFTDVFSDPSFDGGHGERTFVNSIGSAWELTSEKIPEAFFEADLICFGGTALVPPIHDDLTMLLRKAKMNDCITLVNTVFDFRNEKKNPGQPWPLVESEADFQWIDVLILDCEEALKTSGRTTMDEAAEYFKQMQVSSFIITNGSKDLLAFSDGKLFGKMDISRFPVSAEIIDLLTKHPELKCDTTGCGDNFVGGFITSLALQLKSNKKGEFDLPEAISWAVASGGFTCFYVGGTYFEKETGEKHSQILKYQNEYLNQISI